MIVRWYEGWDDKSTNEWLPAIGGHTPTIHSTSEFPVHPNTKPTEIGEQSPTPDIEMRREPSFEDSLDINETIKSFAPRIGECSGLLGVTMEVTNLENPDHIVTINLKRTTSEQAAAAVIAAEECPWILHSLLLARRVMIGVVEERSLARFWANRLTCHFWAFSPIIPNRKLEIQGYHIDARTDTVPTDDGGRISVRYKDYVDVFSKNRAETIAPHHPIDHRSTRNKVST
jgi:hypothetical protein